MSHRGRKLIVATVVGIAFSTAFVADAHAVSIYTGYSACARAGDAGVASGQWSSYACTQLPAGEWGGKPVNRFILTTAP